MIIIDATTEKIQIVLSAAVTLNELQWTTNYAEMSSSMYTPINNDGLTSGTTPVDIISSPAASTQRMLKYLSVYNADTAPVTVTIQKNTSSVIKTYCKITLNPADTLQYSDRSGFSVLENTSGMLNQPTVNLAISANNTSASGGTVNFSNSNRISFSNNAGTITGTYSWRTLTMSFLEINPEYNANAAATNSAAANLSLQRVFIPYDITATRLDVIAHLTVVGSTAGSWSIRAGIYTRSGNSLFSVSSTSGVSTWNSGGATSDSNSYSGVSGTRIRTLAPSNWAFTPGEYWFGIINSVQGPAGTTGSVTMFGQSSVAVTNYAGERSLRIGNIGMYGIYSYGTASFPSTIDIPTEIVFIGANAANARRQPSIRIYG